MRSATAPRARTCSTRWPTCDRRICSTGSYVPHVGWTQRLASCWTNEAPKSRMLGRGDTASRLGLGVPTTSSSAAESNGGTWTLEAASTSTESVTRRERMALRGRRSCKDMLRQCHLSMAQRALSSAAHLVDRGTGRITQTMMSPHHTGRMTGRGRSRCVHSVSDWTDTPAWFTHLGDRPVSEYETHVCSVWCACRPAFCLVANTFYIRSFLCGELPNDRKRTVERVFSDYRDYRGVTFVSVGCTQ